MRFLDDEGVLLALETMRDQDALVVSTATHCEMLYGVGSWKEKGGERAN